jgi:hypothetical protein
MRDAQTFLESEKLVLYRSYDPEPALEFVRQLAGVAPRVAEEVTTPVP